MENLTFIIIDNVYVLEEIRYEYIRKKNTVFRFTFLLSNCDGKKLQKGFANLRIPNGMKIQV